jgi:HlyD family secretion protein
MALLSETQLPSIKVGQEVEVLIDDEKAASKKLTGTITWISSKAEFTPKCRYDYQLQWWGTFFKSR